GRVPVGQGDAAGGEEAAYAVVARLAVDVVEVVLVGVRAGLVTAFGQEVGEQRAPGVHVHLGGRGQDAVEVEQDAVEVAPLHRRKLRGWTAVGQNGATTRTSPTGRPCPRTGAVDCSARVGWSWPRPRSTRAAIAARPRLAPSTTLIAIPVPSGSPIACTPSAPALHTRPGTARCRAASSRVVPEAHSG